MFPLPSTALKVKKDFGVFSAVTMPSISRSEIVIGPFAESSSVIVDPDCVAEIVNPAELIAVTIPEISEPGKSTDMFAEPELSFNVN